MILAEFTYTWLACPVLSHGLSWAMAITVTNHFPCITVVNLVGFILNDSSESFYGRLYFHKLLKNVQQYFPEHNASVFLNKKL